ncbi:2-octaprenyl-6-methoxyphenyl hydroxylase [Endozoicomonas gorgoniicola]|uniref:2-octaprenyl-6-methoxyphenyl hydroxylase n=1 Tax=Endozoicomonas gorgoniicola TaxID=1234144 RepID=A0ABT3N2I9_9GAMM|nr:2-octaprenyl-6-methoxyphenyl hydroxylase [Endozoicomonas gorgoniicola]MCW7555850.1 2-octaprenyl-6-methoxyphenyl hydroxylase [Endozoicomonas gorgoniicola]
MANEIGGDMTEKQFDILIIGGGLVGTSFLCALEPIIKSHQLKVGLIESHDLDKPGDTPPSYDARASALSYGTRLIYEQLGIWKELSDDAMPILDIHVSDRGHFGQVHLNHNEEHVPALGYVIENFRLGKVLLRRLKAFRDQQLIKVLSPAEVTGIKPVPEARMAVEVVTGNDQSDSQGNSQGNSQGSYQNSYQNSYQADLIILADGGRSSLLDKLNISRKQFDYQQHALVANVSLDRPHAGIAYERFAGEGPMALLPLTGTEAGDYRCGLVWTLPNRQIDDYMALDEESFMERLQQLFGTRAGRFVRLGQRSSYPLSLNVAREQVRPGLVVLGNAAHVMHPVAGQGYNLAIRDAMALVSNISDSLAAGKSPGQLSQLLQYVEGQKRDQTMTLDFCDNLVKLFARKETGVILARNLGLTGLNVSRRLKTRFARKAMGL